MPTYPFVGPQQEREPTIDELLAGAKGALGRSDEFLTSVGARTPQPAPRKAPTPLRGFTDLLDDASMASGVAGIVPSPASGPLLALSSLLALPGGARKLISPEEDESRVGGAFQTGLAALPGWGAARRLAGRAGKAYQGGADLAEKYAFYGPKYRTAVEEPVKRAFGASLQRLKNTGRASTQDLAYGGVQRPVMTGSSAEQFRRASRGFTEPAEIMNAAESVVGSDPRSLKVLQQLVEGGDEAVALRRARRYGYGGSEPSLTRSAGTNPSYESLEHVPGWEKLPEGGIGTITPESLQSLLSSRGGVATDLAETASDWGPDLMEALNAQQRRLSIPARARAFRSNSPLE